MKLSRSYLSSRRRPLALLATAAAMCLLGALVPNAFAATGTADITVTVVNNNLAVVIGHNFTAGGTADVQVTAGADVQAASALIDPDGRFSAATFLPDNYSGDVSVTATAGSETATGTASASGTGAASGVTASPSPVPVPDTTATDTTDTTGTGTVDQASSGGQTQGVGGVKPPAGAILSDADSTADLNIDQGGGEGSPKVYDGQGHTVGTIHISADWVTVENFKIVATGQYGVESKGHHITIQNNDIKNVHASGDGDLNAITFSGDYHTIAYNTAVDFVTGDPGGSHTDAIQTWVSDSHLASSYVLIKGNKFSGPDKNAGSPIHQCVMAEALGRGGNSGGSGESAHWLIADNYFKDSWNQCIKLDGINDVSLTRNEFAGNSSNVFEDDGTGNKFYDDNKITGSYGSKPATVPGPGPTTIPGL